MSIKELTDIVSAPEHPIEIGDIQAWRVFEQRIGLEFPKEWYDVSVTYGTGAFGGELKLLNPFSSSFSQILNHQLEILRYAERYDAGGDPYSLHPDRPGLFPWARDANGYGLCWYTEGDPDEWPIIVTLPREEETGLYQMSMTAFLVKAFKGEIQEPIRYEPMSEENRFFVPAKLSEGG